MRPTRVSTLACAARRRHGCRRGASCGWPTVAARACPTWTGWRRSGSPCSPSPSWSSWVALRSRLRGDRLPDPLGVARMAVLGKASAHVGPIVGGFYLGYLLVLLPGVEIASRRERAVIAVVALAAAGLLTVAGLLLERACRIRGGDSPDLPDDLDDPARPS